MTADAQTVDEARVTRDLALPWLDEKGAPRDGSRIRLHRIGRNGGIVRWPYLEVGRWREITDHNGTLKGWFNDQDEYLGVADSWLPLETDSIQ